MLYSGPDINRGAIMRIGNWVLVWGGLAAVLALAPWSSHRTAAEGVEMNRTMETIFSRKSVRSFKPGKIERSQLEWIVRAGMAAPSARDQRPREFVVVTEEKTRNELAQALPYAKMAADAAAVIVVVGDLERQNGGRESDYWIQDCAASAQNVLLAVESMGLGAVWTAVYPNQDRIDPIRRILGLPEHMMPLNVIPVGIPVGTEKPRDKWEEKKLHWEKW